MSLTKADVVRAGVEILDTYGLGDLSMRRLAEHLGVKAGALYWHVANKQSLLAAVSDEILAVDGGPTSVPVAEADLAEGIDEWARCFRRTLLAHRDGAELVASTISVTRESQRSGASASRRTFEAWDSCAHSSTERPASTCSAMDATGPGTSAARTEATRRQR